MAIIYAGWVVADQRYLVAESGIGYWLGILGGLMMLLLLVYPVRKRKPRWKYAGSIKFWFRFHMFLGIAGPVLIILHSGYRLGSLNGSVAFFSMLIVASSGLIGRYLYRRIHHGLYGEKIQFEELYHQNEDWQQMVASLTEIHPEITDELSLLEQKLVNRHTGMNRSLWFFMSMNWKLNKLRRRTRKLLKKFDDSKKLVGRLLKLKSICKLGINEILFSYWHILHLPLFIMLVISGFTHVVVVHFY
ncbi:MAG: transcriptional regulator [Gammaproteobacteria bacterium]|nr:transcriptional regulator [Gammaproteobacteria bacterium]